MNNKELLNYLLLFLICILMQVLIFNSISLFNVAFPIIFIYFIIRLPISLRLSILFTLSFIIGLIVDIFSDTPGVNALSCILIAALKRPIYYAYVDRDDHTETLVPSVASIGFAQYSKFLISFVTIYCILTFTIEYFSFTNVETLVEIVLSSSILSFIILLAVDCLILSKK